VRDPLEGLSEYGTIRTGADLKHVGDAFRPVHEAASTMIHERQVAASVYAYGSVVTGQATVGTSDVDLLTIGLPTTDANLIGADLSARFAGLCRGVEISAAQAGDFVGERDESYGNRVFLRHYCVLLAGSDVHRPTHDFAGDRRAARGFNGDIAQHARRWNDALEAGEDAGPIANRMARKSLLAVAGLVSVHDHTWTTDRETSAHRWSEIEPAHHDGLAQLISWTSTTPEQEVDTVRDVLEGTVEAIVSAFSELIGLWPDDIRDRVTNESGADLIAER
jgi:hypothetical protein